MDAVVTKYLLAQIFCTKITKILLASKSIGAARRTLAIVTVGRPHVCVINGTVPVYVHIAACARNDRDHRVGAGFDHFVTACTQ